MPRVLSISRVLLQEGFTHASDIEIHSTFDHACNLRWGDRLVGIVSRSLGCGPDAIVMDPPQGGFAAHPAWQPGRRLHLNGTHLTLDSGLVVELHGAQIWDPEPQRPLTRGDLGREAARLGQALREHGAAGALHEPALAIWADMQPPVGPARVVFARLGSLQESLLIGSSNRVAAAASSLVGLGPGLTPAGDDLLAGLTAVLVRACKWDLLQGPVCDSVDVLVSFLLNGCHGRTTLQSETMLRSAARGWLAEPASQLTTDLLGGAVGSLRHLPAVLQIGHTSGADMAAGIYMALQVAAAVMERTSRFH